jgi:hypothetical protein
MVTKIADQYADIAARAQQIAIEENPFKLRKIIIDGEQPAGEFGEKWFNAEEIRRTQLWKEHDDNRLKEDFSDNNNKMSAYLAWLARATHQELINKSQLEYYSKGSVRYYCQENIQLLLSRMIVLKLI